MSAITIDYHMPAYGQVPHRKPVPQILSTDATSSSAAAPPPSDQTFPHEQLPAFPQIQRTHSHSRTRTSSSTALPEVSPMPPTTVTSHGPQPYLTNMAQYSNPARRTLSNATASTSSTNASSNGTTNQTRLRRSSSGRSGSSNSPTSYVALMRKQKATVWCDRAQQEDPRILAQQRAAKMRATMEVVGGHHHSLSGSQRNSGVSLGIAGGVRSKIRHHTAPKASTYTPANLSGSGVPMRLSASEVDEGDSDDADGQYLAASGGPYHHRSGSDRSSVGSARRFTAVYAASPNYLANGGARFSTVHTPPSGHEDSSPAEDDSAQELADETPVPGRTAANNSTNTVVGPTSPNRRPDYFAGYDNGATTRTGLSAGSGSGSGSSSEREHGFGRLGAMPEHTIRDMTSAGSAIGGATTAVGRATTPTRPRTSTSATEDLRRRGSVDDRTGTMSGAVKLYVANPDLSDDER